MPENTPAGTAGAVVPQPAGWSHFGTHIDEAGRLEFSEAHDSAGNPLWERPVTAAPAGSATLSPLIALATTLDEARITANAIEAAAPQSGVYGDISDALEKTLVLILGSEFLAAQAHQMLVADGLTVEEALETVYGIRSAE